jgi:hypothetical protein
MPAIDVLPSTVVVPRLANKFPRMFRGKGELGCNDVMVVKSEEYHTLHNNVLEEGDSDEEGLANRDLMAVICRKYSLGGQIQSLKRRTFMILFHLSAYINTLMTEMKKDSGGSCGRAEIVLSDGSVWTSSPLPNGLYEFVSIDELGHKTTARWVRRSIKRGSVEVSESTSLPEFKFTFSIIDPNSRRHPILATITQNKLDIPDYYTSVSQSAGKWPPTSPIKGVDTPLEEQPIQERATHAIEENTKRLIQVTGIWLALREGWSPYFRYNDSMASHASPPLRVRSMTMTPDGCRPSPIFVSTPESANSLSTLGVLGSKIRRASTKVSPSNSDSPIKERVPKRSISAGTAFMQREKARRGGNPPSTVASDSEGEGILIRSYFVPEKLSDPSDISIPPSIGKIPCLQVATPETPTRLHQRTQSMSMPPSSLQNLTPAEYSHRHSMLNPSSKHPLFLLPKPKTSRWKSFTNLFRRSKTAE